MSIRRISGALLCALMVTACTSQTAPPAVQAPTSALLPTVAPPAPTVVAPAPTVSAAATVAGPTAAAQPTAAPVVGTGAPTRTLALRDPRLEGEDVRAAQQRLLDLGYRQVRQADGLYGPQTEAAVRAFQQVNALEADGVLGPQTGARLFASGAIPGWTVVPIIEGLLCGGDRIVLGATAGDAWLDNAAAGMMLRGGESYRLYDRDGPLGNATGSAPVEYTEPPLAGAFAVKTTPELINRRFIGVGGAWQPQPRPMEALPSMPERERAAALVADYLRGAGIAQPVVQTNHVQEPLQIDLDGDGQRELLIIAERYEPGQKDLTTEDGYSVVLLQHRVGGALKIEPLEIDVHPGVTSVPDHNSNSLFAALDLNGDGRMEIVVRQSGFEWGGVVVYGFDQGKVTRLLDGGCGV